MDLRGDRRLDADGCVVAPGFVDIHTHYDAQVFWDPALTPSCYHGVTTVVAGNCGFSIAPTRPADRDLLGRTMEKVEDMDPECLAAGIPWEEFESFPEYLDAVRRRGSALNYSAYIGHTPLRLYVLGPEAADRPATPDEVAAMTALIEEAMEAGAAGFATSMALTHVGADGRPIPSRVAQPEETQALCRAVGRSGRGVIGVNGGEGLSFTECYDLQPSFGAPITYTAVLTVPSGAHLKAAEIHRERRAGGADVWPQVSCRPLAFSVNLVEPFNLNTNPVFAELMPRSIDERRAAYADPGWRLKVRDAWAERKGIPPRWDTYEIMESTAHPELVGEKLATVANRARRRSVRHAARPQRRRTRHQGAPREDDSRQRRPRGIAMLLNEPGCTLGLSDAGADVGQLCDAPLPTDLLGNWVREREVLSLEGAVHKLTQEPADLFGFADRGVLRRGAFADVTVFDPAAVGPGPVRRVRDFPADTERLTADQPTGVRHVLVNGVAIRVDGEQRGAETLPGRVVSPADRNERAAR